MVEFQELGETLGVPVVLPQGVLESVLPAKQHLRPFLIILPPKNPAFHVLGFDDKNSERRDKNVIDLRGAPRRRKDNALDAAVDPLVEKHPHAQTGNLFANPAFPDRAQAHASGLSTSQAVIRAGGLGFRAG